MPDTQVLVLGGGIAGCLTACLAADAGLRVTILEQRDQLMAGASRWNEGKLHFGYIYTGTASLATARVMHQGLSVFEDVLERVLGRGIPAAWYSRPTVYLVDRDSMLSPDVLWHRHQAVAALAVEQAQVMPGLRRHLGDGTHLLERLSLSDAERETGQGDLAAAWRTTERAISTRELCDAVAQAVAERTIPVIRGTVTGVEPDRGGWSACLEDGRRVAADIAVNCLWENRSRIDATLVPQSDPVSIRFRRAFFATHLSAITKMSPTSRVLGRYGDVTVCGNGDACLTWYQQGLIGLSDNGLPPVVPQTLLRPGEDREGVLAAHLAGLGLDPAMIEPAERWQLGGGYVVAYGYGDIDRMESPLHERHRPGVHEIAPGYFSVDTGKLTLGPLMAMRATSLIRSRLKVAA